MNKPLVPTALAALALLAGCGGGGAPGNSAQTASPSAPAAAPLAGARIGGPFTLTSSAGGRLAWDGLRGKYRIVYFGYSYCPDVCPLDLARLMAGYRAFAKADPARAAKVQPLFVTVDPERDTPATLKTYVANFPPNLIGLTGTPAEIAAVAKSFAVYYAKQPPSKPGADDYLVDHQRTPYLFGPDGQPIAILSTEAGRTPDDVAKELAQWVR